VRAVGMGSRLISPDLVEQRAYGKISLETKKVLETIREIRK